MSNNPAGGAAGANNGAATDANPGGSPAGDAKTYTQAQLDAMFGERAKSAAAAARADMLKALGFEKEDDAKAALANFKTLQDAQKSEQQKLADRNVALEKERDDWKSKHTDEVKRVNDALMKSAAEAEALKLGIPIERLPATWTLIKADKLALMSVDGEKVKGADEAVKAVLKENDFLKAGQAKPPPNINAGGGGGQADPLAGREKELAVRYRLPFRSK